VSPAEGDVALACMTVFVGRLVTNGLTDACISPGSRSTPLALALHRNAEVRVHLHLDERASAFFALGLAKASGRPVALACTSGTAVAEYLPAVVEASMTRVPLLVLTADRPPELRNVGANQAIEQPGIFGRYVRSSVDAEVPGDRPDTGYWRGLAQDAWRDATSPPPRPVHVNLPFREPLVPSGQEVALEPDVAPARADATQAPPLPSVEDVARLVEVVESHQRGVILAGSLRLAAPSVRGLAEAAGWPLLAEPASGLRGTGALAAPTVLVSDERFASAHVPEVVLQLGAAPVSRAGLGLVGAADRLAIADPDDLVADPHRRAEMRIVADVDALAASCLRRLEPRGRTPWLEEWQRADATVRTAVDRMLDGWSEPFEGRIARDVSASLPEGATLVVGSSMPIRDLDLFMAPRDGLRVLANRGASGIDGFVSTILGVSAAGGPTVGVLGDLTLLHDIGSLLWSARRGYDAVLVVPNNGGGTIFSFLAQRELPELEELFTTPHGLDLGEICTAAGAGHGCIDRADELVAAVLRGLGSGGIQVVEVAIEALLDRRRHAEITAAVAALRLAGG
jgi:2-succinyl-5-enolpyruvyl-6-hydroxy-3-cyclohexene-1-carboxylate synthase